MDHLPSKPLTLSEVLLSSYSLWKATVKRMIGISLIFATILALYDYFVPDEDFFAFVLNKSQNWFVPIHVFISALIALFAYGVVIYMIDPSRAASEKTLVNAARALLAIFHRLILVMMIANFLTLLGYLSFVIPGIYIFILLSLSIPLVIIKGLTPIQALRTSRDLVYGYWWQTAAALLFPAFIYWFVTGLASMGLYFLSDAQVITVNTSNLVYAMASCLVTAILMPLACAVLLLFINDLTLRPQKPFPNLWGCFFDGCAKSWSSVRNGYSRK